MNPSSDFRELQKLKNAVLSAEKSGDVIRMSEAYGQYAYELVHGHAKYDEGIAYRQKELNIYLNYKKLFNDYDRAYAYRFLGVAYHLKQDYNKCIEVYESGLEVLEQSRSSSSEILTEKARSYFNLGISYYERSSKETEQLHVEPIQSQRFPSTDSDSDVDEVEYESLEDELFVFEHFEDLQQSEHYFRLLLELVRKYQKHLNFDEDEALDDEEFCILKLTQAIMTRFRNAVPYINEINVTEVIDLYDRILEICGPGRRDEIMYRKASAFCFFGTSYRAEALETFNAVIVMDNCRFYFKRKALEKAISFTLRIGCFSNCFKLIEKSAELASEETIRSRCNRVAEIQKAFNSDPSDGLAMICCEKGEIRAANDLYSDLIRAEKNVSTRIDLWLDKEAALERWQHSSMNLDICEGLAGTRRAIRSVISEVRFTYLSCLKELASISSLSKRFNDTMLEYAKFLSHHNVEEAIKIYESIVSLSNASSGLKSASLKAIDRLKVQLSLKRSQGTSAIPYSSSSVVESVPASNENSNDCQEPDGSSIGDSSSKKRKKGIAIHRKGKVAKRAYISDSENCEDSSDSSDAFSDEECLGAYLDSALLEEGHQFSEADAARIAQYDEKEIHAKLKEEKDCLKRPIYLTFYFLEIATRLQTSGEDEQCLPYYEQAVAFCPPGAEKRFVDLKNLFFNKGRVHRRLGQWELAIRNLKKATELFSSKPEALECADTLIELGHLYLDEAEKLEWNEYALAFRRCFGRISLKYFEQAKCLLKARGSKIDERRVEMLSHVLSNEAVSFQMQEEKEKAVSIINEAISHCRQFGGLENWFCQSLNTSHDINKSLRRFEDAKNNLRDCLKLAKLKGGENQPSFDFWDTDISKADDKCFGCFYWNSKLNLLKMATQMHKLHDAHRCARELSEMSPKFHKQFRIMVNQSIRHISNVEKKIIERDSLIATVNDPHAGKALDDLRQLCVACEFIEDFDNLALFAKRWSDLATDLNQKCLALYSLYVAYMETQELKQASFILHSLCALQERLNIDPVTRFFNLYKLALLYWLLDRFDSSIETVLQEMDIVFKKIEDEKEESPAEYLPLKAAIMEIKLIAQAEGDFQHLDEEIATLYVKWKNSIEPSFSESSGDESVEIRSVFSNENSNKKRSASNRRADKPRVSRQIHSSRVSGQRSDRSWHSFRGQSATSRRQSIVSQSGTGGKSLRISRNSDSIRSLRRSSSESVKSLRAGLEIKIKSQRSRTEPHFSHSNAIDSQYIDDNNIPMSTHDDCDNGNYDNDGHKDDDGGLLEHLHRMLSDDDLANHFNDNTRHELGHDSSSASLRPVSTVAASDSVSARVVVDQSHFLILCNPSANFQWLIDEATSRFFRDQARRPMIKNLLLDGAIIDSYDLVLPLIRSHPDAKFVAVVSYFEEVAFSVSYKMLCQNRQEFRFNLDIAERLQMDSLHSVDLSYVICAPSSIIPLISILSNHKHALTELIFDCSGFDDSCALLLAEAFSNLKSVKKLSIANTFASGSGVSALLKKCLSLTLFDVHAVNLLDLPSDAIQNFFDCNSCLQVADFSYCNLTRFPLIHRSYPSVHWLNLTGNNLDVSELVSLRSLIPLVEEV